MANPTPGPWTRDAKSPMQLVGADGKKVLTIGYSKAPGWPDQDEAEANMALVLQSLETAEKVVAWFRQNGGRFGLEEDGTDAYAADLKAHMEG